MNTARMSFAALAIALGGCITGSELCPGGFVYSSQYGVCLVADAGDEASTEDAGGATFDAPDPEAGEEGGAEASSADAGTAIGTPCAASTDCSGAASYCLIAPGGTSGYCSITHCAPSDCPAAYSCCTCTSAALSSLQSYPPGVCVDDADATQLVAVGCTCS